MAIRRKFSVLYKQYMEKFPRINTVNALKSILFGGKMDEYARCTHDCKLGMKTYQNILASANYFDRLCTLVDSKDLIVVSSVFQSAVIRYAKPFLNTKTSIGIFTYPTRLFKNIEAYDQSMHDHLLHLRKTLVAHDDFDQIEPHLLTLYMRMNNDIPCYIPVSIAIANKCVSHPSDKESAKKMRNHVRAVLSGVVQKLNEDVGKLRQLTLDNPERAIEDKKYQKNYGQVNFPKEGKRLTPPDFMNDDWLNIDEPDFSEIHNGYRYEGMKFQRNFYGPETIKLPGGYRITLTPENEEK